MDRIQRFIEKLYDTKIQQDYDRIIPIVGDEGDGKSTLILEFLARYEAHRGNAIDAPSLLNYVIWDDKDAFTEFLQQADSGDPIAVMDAAHLMHKKEAMNPDQIETEKTLLDIRIENHTILLGYQDWGDIPDQLQRRRAKNVFRVPQRGVVHGYNRESLDEMYAGSADDWPEPDMEDVFPNLEGTEVWDRFTEIDKQRKLERLKDDDEETEDGVTPQEVAEAILEDGVAQYVDENEFNGQRYISKPLIKFDYPDLSEQQADQVKHAIRRESDVLSHSEDPTGGEGEPPKVHSK